LSHIVVIAEEEYTDACTDILTVTVKEVLEDEEDFIQ
jgi:hypothetical protein